ncbi:MAG: zinc ribbon domain-containing protein [Eubacteriaceae bacterium]|nr:zinc ribbon domain-containing protein [Eubacteriaceae bacterium]
MDSEKVCQSCGMPMSDESLYGKDADGTPNELYCSYCYTDGSFAQDVDMDGMIDICISYMSSENSEMDESTARQMMQEAFPKLERWRS